MLKTLLATSAVASVLAWSAVAQTAPEAVIEESTPPATAVDQAQEVQNEMAPADPGAASETAEETVPDPLAPAPAEEMTAEPAPDPMAPAEGMTAEPSPDPMAPAGEMTADPAPGAGPALEEGWSTVDVATISTDTLIGATIQTYGHEDIAEVQDVLLNQQGQVENVVARFGGFLGFGETTVLLTMDEISVVKDGNDRMFVLTDLSPEALEGRPEYTAPAD
jgi:PRC-barrel domain